jgi:hypothetical protein
MAAETEAMANGKNSFAPKNGLSKTRLHCRTLGLADWPLAER